MNNVHIITTISENHGVKQKDLLTLVSDKAKYDSTVLGSYLMLRINL